MATSSEKSPALSKRRASEYMLCVIQDHGHRIIFSPDFGFHFTAPLTDDPHRWTALTLMKAEKEIEMRLERLEKEGEPSPTPKKWRGEILGQDRRRLGIADAAKVLGLSESSVRRLADEGMLPCTTTRRGHRRFSHEEIANFVSNNKK